MAEPALVIVTGSSHAGKSTLIRELSAQLDGPVGVVAIDDVIENVGLPPALRWEHGLDRAYDLAATQVKELLEAGALVLYESTFTYVPPDGRPTEFHAIQVERLLNLAEELGVRALVVRLSAVARDISERQRRSGRLDAEIVEETQRLHAGESLSPSGSMRLDTSALSPREAASRVLAELRA